MCEGLSHAMPIPERPTLIQSFNSCMGQGYQHTRLVEPHALGILGRGVPVDVVALVGMKVISIVRVRVVQEGLGSASRLAVERNPLPVLLSPSILLVGLKSLGRGITGCVVIDRDILLRAGAVTAAVGQDFDGHAALDESGGGDGDELGEMHFRRCWEYQGSLKCEK